MKRVRYNEVIFIGRTLMTFLCCTKQQYPEIYKHFRTIIMLQYFEHRKMNIENYLIENNHVNILEVGINTNVFTNINFIYMYVASRNYKNLDIIRMLLHNPRFDPSYGEQTPIFHACAFGCLEFVKMLATDPRVNLVYGLKTAIFHEQQEVVDFLKK